MVVVAAGVVALKLGPVVEGIAVLEIALVLETAAAVVAPPAAAQPLVVAVVVVAAVVVGTASVRLRKVNNIFVRYVNVLNIFESTFLLCIAYYIHVRKQDYRG
jgi:hypothetical protein